MLLLKPLIACDVPVSVASSNITVPVKSLAVFTSKRYLSAPEVGAQVNVVDTGIPTAPFAGDVKDDCSVVKLLTSVFEAALVSLVAEFLGMTFQ